LTIIEANYIIFRFNINVSDIKRENFYAGLTTNIKKKVFLYWGETDINTIFLHKTILSLVNSIFIFQMIMS